VSHGDDLIVWGGTCGRDVLDGQEVGSQTRMLPSSRLAQA
jgi:hypothetical protein